MGFAGYWLLCLSQGPRDSIPRDTDGLVLLLWTTRLSTGKHAENGDLMDALDVWVMTGRPARAQRQTNRE